MTLPNVPTLPFKSNPYTPIKYPREVVTASRLLGISLINSLEGLALTHEDWAAADFLDTDLSSLSFFKLYRADVADGRMSPSRVVEPFDVVEHFSPRLVSRPVDLACDAFGLH
jgi:hypothetical protein